MPIQDSRIRRRRRVDLLMVMVAWGDNATSSGRAGRPAGALPPPRVRPDQPCRPALCTLRTADVRPRRRDTSWPRHRGV